MDATKSLKSILEVKLGAVTVDVSLLRADLWKVRDNVTMDETQIHGLQAGTKRLEDQVQVQRQRCIFEEVKKALRAKDITYDAFSSQVAVGGGWQVLKCVARRPWFPGEEKISQDQGNRTASALEEPPGW
ncbi:hypothetical protein NDU88_006813 [Pleurodeles waltl]|uniref:Uncharacterized protein n=1 Tax=Pleurodeles waltl TaxID=8319 RepID=A0AAV7VRR1_PLEWA|nr:hypothetical protein NDU88_006813 [Pleurodeles waltl]